MLRRQLGGGVGSILFNTDLFKYISLACLFVRLFIPYLKILGSISCYGSSTVSDAFVNKQQLYISTATETELIVNERICCILRTKFSYGLTLPCVSVRLHYLVYQ